MSDKSRRSFLFGITVILVFCSFAAVDANRYMWIFISICAFMLLLVDLLFFGVDKFNYDPFYSNWEKKNIQDS
ncbi:conserved Plasmodium protein, unknown function [Plasmodium reichenowi]|uniref:Uncharacterized protein n=11 Tax=Plasmodium (Laverania) TaxID=418107 RepID=Q8IIP3_PLAF7|nr:conserved protein, unknown function [Plasmodium falciparum 3D7]XP_019970302.1 hypothetical protein PRSY57_1110500 [Plasmodium reichenowi]ETW15578.1 hypothetical protein PFFVO_05871 [Plasmodium falciparum Vietnam Oak-Knoll (FVO)]ETW36025.1 hypothetical protein PFTANZ_03250 [Plasmodium falciparum Tanzania (2000708)]ETW42360.1 hypothetical protein PFNF135_03370 [Plasmodium falciparum NF135/5.C10]ETW48652.1 hypothetical protein PFMALIP_03191 [Plasmodium falciparum MaliPS096_E11]ETW52743.1 hypo|eukprot:XP_001347798.2 conserved Plasmodium protein, unknown function [Plasmodium falciparum 3D7]